MKNNLQIFVGVLFTIAIGLFIYYANVKAPVVVETPEVVVKDTITGCYVAKLAKDVYVLKIDSDTNGAVSGMLAFNNYEKDSSSGPFTGAYKDGVLIGDYSFNSEGMDSVMQVVFKKTGDAFVRGYGSVMAEGNKVTFENLADITYDTVATFVKNPNCMETFTEVNNKFIFNYNAFFKAYEPNQENVLPSTDWRMDAKQNGILLARMSIPKAYMPKTNFSNAYLTIGTSTDPKEIKVCSTAVVGEVKEGRKDISGYPFTKFTSSGVGAGNLYETVSYRGLLDGDCYALEYTIHSTNIGNYSPEQGIKEFDKTKVQNELESTIASFKFLVNSN